MATGNDPHTERTPADLPVLSCVVSQTSHSHSNPNPNPHPHPHSRPTRSDHPPPSPLPPPPPPPPPPSSFRDGSDKSPKELENNHEDDTSKAGSSCSGSREDGVDYPEGGCQAWTVVFGSFVSMVAGFGIMNTIGTVQAHLSENQLAHESQGKIGWIFGLYAFLSFFGGVLIGPLFDAFGPRWLLRAGSLSLVSGLLLFSISTAYWQFMLTFGVLTGLGTSLIFTPSVASIGHWFVKRRAYATGVATTGGSVGGIIFPLIIQGTTPAVGFAWAIRIVAFVMMALLLCGNLLVRARLDAFNAAAITDPSADRFPPPSSPSSTSCSDDAATEKCPPTGKAGKFRQAISTVHIDLRAFLDPRFTLTTFGVFFLEWAIFVPLTYITSYALHLGLPPSYAYQLLAILNVGSVFGRWLPCLVADKVGRFNTMIVTACFCLVTVMSLWVPSTYVGGMAGRKAIMGVFAFLYGFGSGSGISLTPVCVGQICTTKEYGTKFGTCYFFASFGTLTGIPIGGQIVAWAAARGDQKRGYLGLVLFCAASYLGALVCFFSARWVGLGMAGEKKRRKAIY